MIMEEIYFTIDCRKYVDYGGAVKIYTTKSSFNKMVRAIKKKLKDKQKKEGAYERETNEHRF